MPHSGRKSWSKIWIRHPILAVETDALVTVPPMASICGRNWYFCFLLQSCKTRPGDNFLTDIGDKIALSFYIKALLPYTAYNKISLADVIALHKSQLPYISKQ